MAGDRGDASRDADAPPDRHDRGRGGDEDPGQVPARAGERGVGPAARAHVRQDVPAHLRGVPGPRSRDAGRGVPPALRAALDAGPDAVRAGHGRAARRRRQRQRRPIGPFLVLLFGVVALARRAVPARRRVGRRRREARRRTPSPRHADGDRDRHAAQEASRRKKKKAAAAARVAAAGRDRPVFVCLVDATGKTVRQRRPLETGQRTKTFRSQRFRTNFGNGSVRMTRRRQALPRRRRRASRSATSSGRARSRSGSPSRFAWGSAR